MKKLFVLAALFLTMLISCTREPENIEAVFIDEETGEAFKLANNQAVDFYFHYPEDFIMDKNAVMISIYVNDHEIIETEFDTGAALSFYVNPNLSAYVFSMQETYDDVERYWNEYMHPALSETFGGVAVELSEAVEVAGIQGQKYIYSGTLGGKEYKFAQIIFFRDREIYTLTYTATPEKFDRHSRVLDIVSETFNFK
ncbi:MAG: hypothetical protein FWH24_01140 [Oscillospiraceae bacterium]|nr:hypothetical protein [Oscillospiraceae bacterium]